MDPVSGEPVVECAVRSDEVFGSGHHPDLPDLLIRFRRDLVPLRSARSARAGLMHAPPSGPRTGDHSDESRLWTSGPGLPTGRLADADVLDLAPTVLSLLDVELPAELDGGPLFPAAAPSQGARSARR